MSNFFFSMKNILSHSGLRKYGLNTMWLISEKVIRMFISLFVGVWVARYLGPDNFGLLSYAQSFVFLFTALATLGLDGIVVRELVKCPSKRDVLLGTAFCLKFVGALVVVPLVVLAVQYTDSDQDTKYIVMLVAIGTVFQSFNVIDFYYQSEVKSKYVAFANSWSLLLTSAAKIVLIIADASLIYFVWIILFEAALLALGLIYYYSVSSALSVSKWRFKYSVARDIFRDSWPLMFSGLVVSIYMKIDQIMIKEMMDAEAVGNYAAALRLSEVWYFVPMLIASSVFPAILNAKNVSEELYHYRLRLLYTAMVWIALFVAIPMTFLGDWIIVLLYGVAYEAAADVLVVHIWSSVPIFLGVAFSKYLTAENYVLKGFYRTFSGAVLNVVLNVYFIKHYGIVGAAVASLISQLVVNIFFDFFDKDVAVQQKLKLSAFVPTFIFKK